MPSDGDHVARAGTTRHPRVLGRLPFFGAQLPEKLHFGDLLIVGMVGSIGFTISQFFATAAFPGGVALAETKMGALLSFVAAPIALVVGRLRRADTRNALAS